MTIRAIEVLSSAEARSALPAIVRRFHESEHAVPVVFGSHRRPEAVILPYSQYERLLALLEDQEIARIVRERAEHPSEVEFDLGDFAASIGVSRDFA